MIALLWVTDGQPECFDAAATSLGMMWRGEEPEITVVDDSGDPVHRRWLEDRCRHWGATIIHHERRLGFAAAIATGWAAVAGADYVFHAEHDFTYDRPVDIPRMQALLDMRPYLAQMSLLRQPVNDREVAAGGLVQSWPGAFEDHVLVSPDVAPWELRWMEQRVYFTTNPSLYRGSLVSVGWPQVAESEGVFTHRLLKYGFGTVSGADLRFGVMGSSTDPPAVTHVGQRQGTGY